MSKLPIMGKNVKLKDIARELNLSKTTVSFVLSGIGDEKGISKATQAKILDYSQAINYRPNQLAQSLTSGITNTIGLIVPSIGDAFYAKLVKEIEKEAEKRGYVILISSSERDSRREMNLIYTMRAKQVDGLVIAPTDNCKKEVEKLLEDNFPFVLVDRICLELDTNYVIIDDEESSYKLVRNLIDKGRRKIAFLTTDTKGSAILNRAKGYHRALKDAGTTLDGSLVIKVPRENYSAYTGDILRELFENHPDIDGFFFAAHYLASETMLYMYKNGMDISSFGLATIHDNPVVEALAPNMSVAKIPLDVMAGKAVNILWTNMKKKGVNEMSGTVIPAKIVIKD